MTTARSPAAALARMINPLLVLLVGCTAGGKVYEIQSGERFCPPASVDLTEGWREEKNDRATGFLVSGCWNGRACDSRLKDIVSVAVTDLVSPRKMDGGYYDTLSKSGRREYSSDGTKYTVRAPTGQHVVFKSLEVDSNTSSPVLATCDTQFCSRLAQHGRYEFSYSYYTKDRFAGDVDAMDAKIDQVLDGWKCRRKGL